MPSPSTWYVTSQEYSWTRERGRFLRAPGSVAHAKAVGSLLTACGKRCDSWQKFWHLSYRPGGAKGSCRECDAIVVDLAASPRQR